MKFGVGAENAGLRAAGRSTRMSQPYPSPLLHTTVISLSSARLRYRVSFVFHDAEHSDATNVQRMRNTFTDLIRYTSGPNHAQRVRGQPLYCLFLADHIGGICINDGAGWPLWYVDRLLTLLVPSLSHYRSSRPSFPDARVVRFSCFVSSAYPFEVVVDGRPQDATF